VSVPTFWLWRGRIPLGKLTVLDDDPGVGKSSVMADIAARVTTASPMPGEETCSLEKVAGVVLMTAEDGLADTVRPRLDAAGADVSRIVALTFVVDQKGERMPSLSDITEIETAINRVDAKLVVIDPLMAYLSDKTDSYRDHDIRRVLAPLAALAERTGVAIVVVRHLNKHLGSQAIYRGGGSIGIIGAARSGLLVAKDPDDPSGETRILASVKCNLTEPVSSRAFTITESQNGCAVVAWKGESAHSAESLLSIAPAGRAQSATAEAEAFLREVLSDGPKESKEIQSEAAAAGISRASLRRARVAVGVVVRREGFGVGGRWIWSLESSGSGSRSTKS
jgi:hypothetical protein